MNAIPSQLSTSTILAAALNLSFVSPGQPVTEHARRVDPTRDYRSSWIESSVSALAGMRTAQTAAVFRNDPAPQGELSGVRLTTPQEELIGEIREWALLDHNWDGEGAALPSETSLRDAAHFVSALTNDTPMPAPMLHATGRAGLYWDERGLYADLEFLGDGRVTYYIEKDGQDKHKGVVSLRQSEMPPVFAALLRA